MRVYMCVLAAVAREDSWAQSYPWCPCVANTCSKQSGAVTGKQMSESFASFILGVHPHVHPAHQWRGNLYSTSSEFDYKL